MEFMKVENVRNKNFIYGMYKVGLLIESVAENHPKLVFEPEKNIRKTM